MSIDIMTIVRQECKRKFSEIASGQLTAYASQLKGLAGSAVESAVKSVHADAIAIGTPSVSDMSAEVVLSFTADLWRPSLVGGGQVQSRWKNWAAQDSGYGVDSIVNLFEHGWNARDSVCGYWHGVFTRSRKTREAGNMLHKAVESFNAQTPDEVHAELLGEYA